MTTFQAIPFSRVGEAFQHADASGYGDAVISVNGLRGYYLTSKAEADRLDALRLVSAYYYDHRGQIVSVPTD